MHSKAKPPTLAEKQRFAAIYEVGCIPCWLEGIEFNPCDIQHVVQGRKRCGHSMSYGCCPYHHRGVPLSGCTSRQSAEIAGPSLARDPKAFHAKYGSEDELVDLCNKMIEPYLQAWRGEYN